MEYKDEQGNSYEISYSQKLQKEQNALLRQKNKLLFVILILMIMFGAGLVYLYVRLEAIQFLSNLNSAVTALSEIR